MVRCRVVGVHATLVGSFHRCSLLGAWGLHLVAQLADWYLGLALRWVALFANEWSQLGYRVQEVKTEGAAKVHSWTMMMRGVLVEQFKFILSARVDLVLRLEHGVKYNFEHIIDHVRYKSAHELAWSPKKRVVIALNQPDPEIFIQKEIETEQFKDVSAVIRVHFALGAKEGINDNVFNARHKVLFNIQVVLWVILVEIPLQVLITQSVSFLVLSVTFTLDLEALIR